MPDSKTDKTPIYLILGTRAQFIKMAPLMRLLLDEKIPYKLIYTAQHQETINSILKIYNLPKPDMVLYHDTEANTMKRIIKWFLYMVLQTFFRFKKILPTQGLVLTHGDTVTAGLAAMMGRFARCDVAHVESGLRSYNILRPFPEELSRLITFTFSNIYFCPNEWAVNNLSFWQGEKINVKGNTMIDGVKFAIESESKHFSFQDQKYAIVSIHRYENIFKPIFTNFIIPKLKQISKNITLVFTLHPTTRERLKKIGMYTSLKKHPNIILHKRFNFINWINVCKHAEFVITDGGSNQEELSYLGTPSILFRKETERKEGLDENIILSKFDNTKINNFIKNYKKYRRPPIYNTETPSQKILNYIKSYTSQ